MSDTFYLYYLILFLMVALTACTPRRIYGVSSTVSSTSYWAYLILPILLYSFFWGLRDGVGADFIPYKNMFLNPHGAFAQKCEIGYQWINQVLAKMGFAYWSIFFVTSALTIIAIYYLARKDNKIFAIALVFFFFTTSYVFSAQNGLRQHMAINFIIIGLAIAPYTIKKFIPLSLLITASILVHKSAIVPWALILILYFCKKLIFNKYLLIGAVLMSYAIGTLVYEYVFQYFEVVFIALDYEGYYDNFINFNMDTTLSSGFGILLKYILYIIVIWNQDLFIKKDKEKNTIYLAYMLFIIGIICEPIFAGHMILRRMILYFLIMKFVMFAYTATALWERKTISHYLQIFALIAINLMLYGVAILNNSNYVVPYNIIELHILN